MKQIKEFKDKYEFLSNFYPVTIKLDGLLFPSVEHAFVAAKTLNINERKAIQLLDTPGKAKRFGRNIELREDWEDVKEEFMFNFLLQKFQYLKNTVDLFNTENSELIESNTWHDNEWGSCICSNCGDKGKNKLGKLLMKVRDIINHEDKYQIDTEVFISNSIISKY